RVAERQDGRIADVGSGIYRGREGLQQQRSKTSLLVAEIVVMNLMRSFSAALALIAVAATPVLAQDAQQQAAKRPTGPQIMKTFGGWDVRCFNVATAAPCDVWEAIAFKKGGNLAVSVSVVYVPSQNRHLMQFIVPLGVDIAKGAKLTAGSYSSDTMPYHHCD